MNRVASLFLPQLPIERMRAGERSRRPLEPARPLAAALPPPVDDDPGTCSVPRGGGWRPGARWARDGAMAAKPSQLAIDRLPAHQRPTMREMGRRSEAAEHPFRNLRGDNTLGGSPAEPTPAPLTWVQHLAIGASRATRDATHLKRMFALRLAEIDPGLGIEAMHLAVPHSEMLGASAAGALIEDGARPPDLAPLVDQLVGRCGPSALFCMTSRESDVPERAVRQVGPLTQAKGWPAWKRPARLLHRPEPLSNVIALLPDHPPCRFTWRRQDYRVVAGDGPERIHGEWWRRPGELWAVRDYFRVETEGGLRFWVFRRGDGIDQPTGDLSWYMHGVFG